MQTPKKVTAADIDAKIDLLFKQSTGKRIGVFARSTALVGLFLSPFAAFEYYLDKRGDNSAKKAWKTHQDSSPVEVLDPIKIDPDGVPVYEIKNSGSSNNNGNKANWLDSLDKSKKEIIGITAAASLLSSAFVSYRSFTRHDKAMETLKVKYKQFLQENPNYQLPSNEEVMKDFSKVRKWGDKVLEDRSQLNLTSSDHELN